MIRLEAVSKRYPGMSQPAVDALDLEFPAGSLSVLVGHSGCGKTSTLKMINRLVEPDSGRIFLDDVDVSSRDPVALRRQIGYVIQSIGLFPHLTVAGNIAQVPELLGWSAAACAERVDELLELVHLPPDSFRRRLPRELSGGQQQRVGIARALAARPRVLLMDEPFGALDPVTRGDLRDELRALQQQLNLTVVMVSHDITEALLLADTVAVMAAGRLVMAAAPAELLQSDDPTIRSFLRIPLQQAAAISRLQGVDT